jgi:hypothetical protein
MVKFRCCAGAWSIIILAQVLHASTRSTRANDILRNRAFLHKSAVFGSSSQTSTTSRSMSLSKPNSTSWTQSRLGALYETRENEVFASTFDTVFSSSCEVRANHIPSTVDAFKESISSHRAAGAGVTLSWENVIATSDSPDEVSSPVPQRHSSPLTYWKPSVVAGTLIVTRSMKFRIRAAPAQRQTHINFSVRYDRSLL